MNPFRRLGLKRGCDAREIKRAYARELKRCRPDDDPEGFQALNQAYRQCLQWTQEHEAARAADEADDDDDIVDVDADDHADDHADRGTAAAPDADAHAHAGRRDEATAAFRSTPPQPQTFDLPAFLEELLDLAQRRLTVDLQRWLRDCEPLYSLQLKQALRAPVAHALAQREPPLSLPAVEAIAEYFDLGALHDPDPRLRHWLALACDRSERSAAFEHLLERYRSHRERPADRWLLAELRERAWAPRRALIALIPGLPGRLRALLWQLHQIGPQWLHSRLNGDSVDFWLRATDRDRLDPRRIAIAAARVALYYLGGAGLLSALTDFDPAPLQHAARNVVALFAVWMLVAAAAIGLRRLLDALALRFGLDPLSALAGTVLLGLAGTALRWPMEALLAAFVAGFALVCLRRSAPLALLCYLAGICAGGAWLPGPVPDSSPAPALVVIAAAAVLPIHDLILARRLGVPAAQVRAGVGKLWWVVLALVGLAACGLLAPR